LTQRRYEVRVSDLTCEQRRAALAHVRTQLGEDRYREFVDLQGEDNLLDAVLQASMPSPVRWSFSDRSSHAWDRAGESWLAVFFAAACLLYYPSGAGFGVMVVKVACFLALTLVVWLVPVAAVLIKRGESRAWSHYLFSWWCAFSYGSSFCWDLSELVSEVGVQ
jgi:hypothetical protein